MFTGIIEALAKIEKIEREGENIHFWFSCPFVQELKVDQSLAHDGVCLTVVEIKNGQYRVTAIAETLLKTNLSGWREGGTVNLERAMLASGRFDGHIVQGHVDLTAVCIEKKDQQGSWLYTFQYNFSTGHITVEKGSICVNGISLTVVNSAQDKFSVAIIPFTYNHTNIQFVQEGDTVNLEFDIIGKYISKLNILN